MSFIQSVNVVFSRVCIYFKITMRKFDVLYWRVITQTVDVCTRKEKRSQKILYIIPHNISTLLFFVFSIYITQASQSTKGYVLVSIAITI